MPQQQIPPDEQYAEYDPLETHGTTRKRGHACPRSAIGGQADGSHLPDGGHQ
jgi:hypothetical protein